MSSFFGNNLCLLLQNIFSANLSMSKKNAQRSTKNLALVPQGGFNTFLTAKVNVDELVCTQYE
jgi:hypothetical protein